jgi:glyoxylase-like metal-dependent hydrolase (beta-lactamase superfamily II)
LRSQLFLPERELLVPVCNISGNCLQIKRFNLMNAYLVREPDGLTLVDTAMGAGRIILEAARQLGQPIRRILLTHAHIDHVGSVDVLKKLVPEIQVLIGGRDAQLLAEARRGVKPARMTLLPGEPQTPVKGGFKKLKTAPDELLEEDHKVGSLRVIATPGHTPGHLAFLDERDGSLYAGDALATFGEVRLPFDPVWYFPVTRPATWHFETALESARRLLERDFARILPGHGPAIEQARAALEKALSRAPQRLRK